METPVVTVFLYALLTAVATGLGALPLLFRKRLSRRSVGLANGAAAGLMLAASFRLIDEGVFFGMPRTILGVVAGLAAIVAAQRVLSRHEFPDVGALKGADTLKALLILGVMTLHSFAEGIGVGVSFGGELGFGIFITLAIAVHNIPEGIAISLVLVPRGVPVWRAALWSVFTSLPQPLMAVPAYLFVKTFEPVLPVGLGLAAGAMIWMAISELLPDAFAEAPKEQVAIAATLAAAMMVAFQVVIGS